MRGKDLTELWKMEARMVLAEVQLLVEIYKSAETF
jgi:hypothetical protein